MILLLGASGYIGSAFAHELARRQWSFKPLSRAEIDYSQFEKLYSFLKSFRPEFVINAAGVTGKPNVDACEEARSDTLLGNMLLPHTIALACSATDIPWGHVASGCIYSGAKVTQNGQTRVERDMTRPELRALADTAPQSIRGFTEEDKPNFSFRNPPCSFYSASKVLGEEAIEGVGRSYVWRLRIPFDEFDSTRNYLSKIQRYPKAYDNVNSISHRGDYVKACLDLWERRAPVGTYNVTNPGFVTTRQVAELLRRFLVPDRVFEFWKDDAEFYRLGAKTVRSNCVLDVSKLLSTGVKIRPVEAALEASMRAWKPEPRGS